MDSAPLEEQVKKKRAVYTGSLGGKTSEGASIIRIVRNIVDSYTKARVGTEGGTTT